MIRNISGIEQYVGEINKAFLRFSEDVKELNRQLLEELDRPGELDHTEELQAKSVPLFDLAEGQGRR